MRYVYDKATGSPIMAENDQVVPLLETGVYVSTVEECDVVPEEPAIGPEDTPPAPPTPPGPPGPPTDGSKGKKEAKSGKAPENAPPNPYLEN